MSNQEELVDEEARRRFEADWISSSPKAIESYLPPPDHPSYWPTLEELICIDLEFAWKQFSGSPKEETVSLGASPTSRLQLYSKRFSLKEKQELFHRLKEFDQSIREKSREQRRSDKETGVKQDTRKNENDTVAFGSNIASENAAVQATHQEETDFGEFTLKRVLGRGGMGIVFEAIEKKTQRLVALKMIRSNFVEQLDGETMRVVLERFQTEARAVASLDHPNIVTLFQVGQYNKSHFIAMQLVNGSDLATKTRRTVFDGKTAARYIRDVASAICAAHQQGIIHRDIKPHNILLDDDSDRVLVTDFGLAKLASDNDGVTLTGELMGTPGYMSPEQAQGKVVTELTDVYSMGATLYCLIGGRAPFQASDTLKTIEQIVTQAPIAPCEVNPEIDRDLNTICLKCLEKNPAARYQSANELMLDLERYINGDPILARPIGFIESTVRWCKRNPMPTTIMVSVFLLLISAIVGWGFTQHYATQSKNNEIQANKNADETKVFADLYQANHNLALGSLREQMYEISENLLLKVPGVKQVRRRLLQKNRTYFQAFIEQNDQDQKLPADLAFAHFAIGKLDLELGFEAKAVESLQTAIKMQTENLARNFNDEAMRFDLGNSLNLRGECYTRINKHELALSDFNSAYAIRKQLVDDFPADSEHLRKFANVEMNLGNWFAYNSDDLKALNAYQSSAETRGKIFELKPADEELLYRLEYDQAKCYYNAAMSHFNLEDDIEAAKKAASGLTLFTSLHKSRPRAIDVMRDYTWCAQLVASLNADSKASPEVRLAEIINANESLYKLFPEEKQLPGYLGISLIALGDYQLEASQKDIRRLALAKAAFSKARVSFKEAMKTNVEYETGFVESLLGLVTVALANGENDEALDLLGKAENAVIDSKDATSTRFDYVTERISKLKAALKKNSGAGV